MGQRLGLWAWFSILRRVFARVGPDQIGLIAAGAAFYMLLAVFPAIAALMALAGMFADPDKVVVQLQSFADYLPEEAANILLSQAQLVASVPNQGLSLTLLVSVAFAIYSLTRATTGLVHGLNKAYAQIEDRGFIVYWGVIIALTAAVLFGAVMLLLLLVALPAALAFLPPELGAWRALGVARWVVVALVVMTGLAALYRFGPAHNEPKWRWLTIGAVVAGVLWFAGSVGFTMYVANFATYNETFGSLGGVIILLTWLWLSAYIVLLGAVLDAEIAVSRATAAGGAEP